MAKYSKEYIKQETIRLYRSLPQDEEVRKSKLDIRDRIIELNYTYFGYVASHTAVNNPSVTYEDKFQSALCHFLECWWWYLFEERYRTDLSFAVFFKPRLSEMIRRELNEVKYSVRRTLCMEAGKQVDKHWAQVTYDDLKSLNLSNEKLSSLKAMFGTVYLEDIPDYEQFISSDISISDISDLVSDKYDSILDLLIHEMVEQESKLSPKYLKDMAEMYTIDYDLLLQMLPIAERTLYNDLQDRITIMDMFASNINVSGVNT